MVYAGARNAGKSFAKSSRYREATEYLSDLLSRKTPPVGVHADFQSWVCENRRCPFDSMDFRHEGAAD